MCNKLVDIRLFKCFFDTYQIIRVKQHKIYLKNLLPTLIKLEY